MTRRRVIYWLLVCALAAPAIAVQHDTFVRRWLLPSRRQPLLKKVVPSIRFARTQDARPIEHLAAVAGVRIVLPAGVGAGEPLVESSTNQSVDLILIQLMAMDPTLRPLVPFEADGVIQFRNAKKDLGGVRMYDMSDLLPSITAAAPDQPGQAGSARTNTLMRLRTAYQMLRSHMYGNAGSAIDLGLLGNALVVAGNEDEQRLIQLLLEFFRTDEDARREIRTGAR